MHEKKLKKIAGWTLLVASLAAPFALMSRPAAAGPTPEICYVGKIGRPLGIVLELDSPDLADLLVRARVATYDWDDTGRSFRGYDVCQPLRKKPF